MTTLSEAGNDLLWTVAQHKYGWAHVSNRGGRQRTLQTAEALARRGLVTIRYRSNPVCVATDAGRAEIARRWPVSPFNLGTYAHQPEGWDARNAWKTHELREQGLSGEFGELIGRYGKVNLKSARRLA